MAAALSTYDGLQYHTPAKVLIRFDKKNGWEQATKSPAGINCGWLLDGSRVIPLGRKLNPGEREKSWTQN